MDIAVLRSFLYVPAHREQMVAKALSGSTSADAVIVDLEDGVPLDQRDAATATLAHCAGTDRSALPVLCRIRSGRDQRAADVELIPSWFAGVLLAKAEDASDLQHVSETLASRDKPLPIWLLIESARGVESLPTLLSAAVPVAGVMLGAGDLRADLGLFDVRDERPLEYARSRIVYAAVAAGVRTIVDSPDAEIEPTERYLAATRHARDMGFTARAAIHPRQLTAIHEAYRNRFTDEQRSWARAVLDMSDGAQRMNGELTDEATKRWARRILETNSPERTS